jgi:hypothetical protein
MTDMRLLDIEANYTGLLLLSFVLKLCTKIVVIRTGSLMPRKLKAETGVSVRFAQSIVQKGNFRSTG